MESNHEPAYRIERWTKEHDASQFSSNLSSIQRYIQEQAHRDVSSKTSAVFVLVESGRKLVIGYYALSSISVLFPAVPEKMKKRIPRYPEVSGILLGRLGVDKNFSKLQTKIIGSNPRLGELLLIDAQKRCLEHSQDVGSALMVVDVELPTEEELKGGARDPLKFYLQYGFIQMTVNPRRVVKSMRAIALEFESA